VLGMEVRWAVLLVKHANDDPVERRDDGHLGPLRGSEANAA
jgi:hypothetical protein